MKKSMVVLIGIIGISVFAGCSKSESSAAEKSGKVVINCMVQSSPEAQFVARVAEAYMKEPGNENITIAINEIGRDNVFARIQNQLFTRSQDVDFFYIMPSMIGAMAEGDVLEPLDSYFEDPAIKAKGFTKSNFTDAGIQAGTYNGKLYALPLIISTQMLFYRTDLIPNPPQTWEEYLEIAKKFTRSLNPSSPTPYGTTLFGKPNQNGTNVAEYEPILWSRGGEMLGPNMEILVNNPINVKALDFWADFYINHLVPPDANNYEYVTVAAAFEQEQVAMCIEWNAAAGEFSDPQRSPKIYDKFAAAPIPGTKQADGSIKRIAYLDVWNSPINKFSNHKKETFDFLSYLYSPDVFIKHLDASMTTGITDVLNSDKFKELKDATHSYEAYKLNLESGRANMTHKDIDAIISFLDEALQAAMFEVTSSQAALDKASKDIADLLNR